MIVAMTCFVLVLFWGGLCFIFGHWFALHVHIPPKKKK
jgi:hypothetical protein